MIRALVGRWLCSYDLHDLGRRHYGRCARTHCTYIATKENAR